MYRSLTVLLTPLIFACSAAETFNGPVVLGLFQKVHVQPNTTNGNPTIFIKGTPTVQNTTEADEIVEEPESLDEIVEVPESPQRIIGGRLVSITEVPWQAALIQDRRFTCGASVISTIWVLTAGHCIYGLGNSVFTVRAGSDNFRTGGQLRRVGFMAVNGEFMKNQFTNDIGMLRVTQRFTFDSTVQPIRIATPYTRIPTTFFVSGWGTTNQSSANPSRLLRGVDVNLVNRRICKRSYAGSNYTSFRNTICAGNIQTGGKDSCEGDSGGPLVSNGVQFGIVSYGVGCGQARFPGVYTDVGALNSWILTVARTFSRRSFPDEKGEHDIRRVIVDIKDTNESSDTF